MTNHPSTETLVDYAAGEMPAEDSALLGDHLATCVQCAKRVALYRLVRDTLASARNRPAADELPASARTWAIAIFRSRFPRLPLAFDRMLGMLEVKVNAPAEASFHRLLIAILILFIEPN